MTNKYRFQPDVILIFLGMVEELLVSPLILENLARHVNSTRSGDYCSLSLARYILAEDWERLVPGAETAFLSVGTRNEVRSFILKFSL